MSPTAADRLALGVALWGAGVSFPWFVVAPLWLTLAVGCLLGWLAGRQIGLALNQIRGRRR